MSQLHLRKYNQATTINFNLFDLDGVDMSVAATFAAGDIKIMKDEGAEANTGSTPTDEGSGYSLALTATEMTAARVMIHLIDQTATKVWLDTSIVIETYGNASATHAFDLDTASTAQTGDSFARLGAPAGASVSADLVVIDNFVDGIETAVITNAVGADVSADIATLQGDTDDIQTRLPSALVGGLMSSDVTAISTDTVAADNLESQFDTTGLAGDTFPATQQQVGNLSTGSAAISVSAESRVLTTGSEVNAVTDTEALDGVYHEITDAAGAMDIYYQFDVGGNGIGVETTFSGRLNGNNDTLIVEAYDWAAAGFTQIGTLIGVNGTTDSTEIYNILAKHTGTGANLGKIRIRFSAASGLTTAVLFVDQLFLAYSVITNSVGYAGGQVWIDTADGTAGTESFVNGVADNPVLSFADALTIASNLSLHRYHITPDSSVTLAASFTNSVIESSGGTVALGGQDVSRSHFVHVDISGVCLTATADVDFTNCEVANVTCNAAHFMFCGLNGTITLGAVNSEVTFVNCQSLVGGGSNPIIDFGASTANHDVVISNYHNGLEIQNFNAAVGGGTDTLDLAGEGLLIINANCDGGTVNLRGEWNVTNNSGGLVSIVYDDETTSINAIEVDTNELQTDWTNGGRLDLLLDQLITQIDTAASEPGQGAPPVSAKMALKIDYLYKWTRNRATSTATTINHYADDGSTVDQKATHSDDGTTYDRTEVVTGP